MIATTTNNQK